MEGGSLSSQRFIANMETVIIKADCRQEETIALPLWGSMLANM